MYLSKAQQQLFWRTFAAACRVHAVPQNTEARNYFRQGLIEEACGKRSLTQVRNGAEFDKLMLETARAAGDSEMVDYFAGDAKMRHAHMAEAQVRAKLYARGENPTPWHVRSYLSAVLEHTRGSHLLRPSDTCWWEKLTDEDVLHLLRMTAPKRSRSAERKRSC